MNKIVTFFTTVFKSSTQPTYGNDVLQARTSFSVKYFLVFNLFATLAVTAVLLIPLSLIKVASVANEILSAYPNDLIVEVTPEEGLTVNQPLPYSVYLPGEYSEDDLALVTFASDSAISNIDMVDEYRSLAVVTNDRIYVRDDNKVEIHDIPQVDERFVFTKVQLEQFADSILNHPFIKSKLYLPLIGIVVFLLVYPGLLIARAFTLAVYSLVVFFASRFVANAKHLTYGQVFRLSLHSITPVILLAFVFSILGQEFFHGLIYFLAYFVWTMVWLFQLQPRTTVTSTVVATPVVNKPSTVKPAKVSTKKAITKAKPKAKVRK